MTPDERKEFHQQLLNKLRHKGFTDKTKPALKFGYHVQEFPSEVSDLTYNADVGGNPRVFISIPDTKEEQRVFDTLRRDCEAVQQIEKELGINSDPKTEIIWKTGPGNIAVRIDKSDDNLTEEVRAWMVDYLIKFKDVFDLRVRNIINDLSAGDE